ncbi:MAG: tetratricopeptide repeat protein [Reichenbachiella sp.]
MRYLFSIALLIIIFSCQKNGEPSIPVSVGVNEEVKQSFVGVESCKSCHEKEYKSWKGSHHDEAMKVASERTVKGDFDNAKYSSNGVDYKFFKKGDDYYVNTQDGDGQYKDFKIAYTFGITPLQQYLIPFPKGAYQSLQAAWDDQKNEWFDVQERFVIDTAEWLHWSRGAARWNTMCADCHSTNVHKNFDPTTETYNTTFDEINVACESCHGPGSEHVQHYAESREGKGPQFYMHSEMESTEVVDKCARCHSRRGQLTEYFDYEGGFLDHYNPALLTNDIYEPDGQILDEVYVYNSFVQSKMYHNGVSCRDCHDVHSLKLKKEGNALCMQCHEPNYDTPSHHKHRVNTESSLCVSCHMKGRVYMGNDYRRDHSFRVPRPDQSVQYGTTNACNECHQDKSAQWAADVIVKEYGTDRPEHFSDLFLPGVNGNQNDLYKLIMDASYPEVARATAIHYYGQSANIEEIRRVAHFLKDSSALIRAQIAKTLSNRSDEDYRSLVVPLLKDSIRLVRVTAAQFMTMVDPNASKNPAYQRAMNENLESLKMQSDFASGQHALAIYYEGQGELEKAIAAYRKAIGIDNFYNQAKMNLALILYRQGKTDEAIILYENVVSQEPEYAYTYYMLGLLHNELGNVSEALKYLDIATKKEPYNSRAFYNYAVLLLQQKDFKSSINAVDSSVKLFGMQEDLLYIKLLALSEKGDKAAAVSVCEILIGLNPTNTDYPQLLAQLKSQL